MWPTSRYIYNTGPSADIHVCKVGKVGSICWIVALTTYLVFLFWTLCLFVWSWASVSYHHLLLLLKRERERSRYIYNVISSHLVSSLL